MNNNTITNTKLAIMYDNMYKRCYSQILQKYKPSYKECSVCEEWYNPEFAGKHLRQNKNPYRAAFYQWVREHFYSIEGQPTVQLDKDIRVKGNKVYSPQTCMFVPMSINSFFGGIESASLSHLPKKVEFDSKSGKFSVKGVEGCLFDTVQDAWQVAHALLIQQRNDLCDRYYGKIPQQVYDCIMKYDWKITD